MPDSSSLIRTLADLLSDLDRAEGLTPARRRDLRSAVRRLSALVDREPSRIPANPASLRRLFEEISPAQAGLALKTVQNLKSNLLAALKAAGAAGQSAPSLGEEWQALYDRLADLRFRSGLGRFLRYCSAEGMSPQGVDDRTVEGFVAWLREHTLTRKPNDCHRQTCRLWNMAADTVTGWPQRRLTVPSFKPPQRTLPLSAFPESFQREVRRYREWIENPDPFDDERPRKALRPTTIRNRMAEIEIAASAWASASSPDDLTSLARLVSPDGFKRVLRHYLQRNQPPSPAFLNSLAQTLYTLAREWVQADRDQLDALRALWRKLPTIPPGLTAKNRALLRQFEDPGTRARLLRLPGQLFKEAGKAGPGSDKAMVLAQLALAIELLIMAPIRMSNLMAIRVGHELVRPGGPVQPYRLVFEASQTKNSEPLEFKLPEELGVMIDRYLKEFHRTTPGAEDSWLFTNVDGAAKAQGTLSQQITETLTKHVGVHMTPHQFRHLGAFFYLRHHPGDFVTVQKLLGHKSIKTTMNAYAQLDSATAARRYDALIAGERAKAVSQPSRRRHR